MTGHIHIQTGIDEETQMSSHQNGSLHSGPGNTAITIDTEAKFPPGVTTEAEMKAYLQEALAPLCEAGWNFTIVIGEDTDSLNSRAF